MRTNRNEFAKLAVDLLLPLVEQRGLPLSVGHPFMEARELKINGLVVMCSQSIVLGRSDRQRHTLLDVWLVGGTKVLSVSLPPLKILSFEPGAWMGLVSALAGDNSTAANGECIEQITPRHPYFSTLGPEVEPQTDRRRPTKMIWHLVVPRPSVESGDASSILSHLRSMSSDASSAWEMRGRLSISFDGYQDDSRSIFTVPEVRRYVSKVHAEWPYWFFFLNQIDHSLKVIAACLCDMQRVEPASWKLSQFDLMRFVGVGMTGMGELGKQYRFDEAEMDAIATAVVRYLHAELG